MFLKEIRKELEEVEKKIVQYNMRKLELEKMLLQKEKENKTKGFFISKKRQKK